MKVSVITVCKNAAKTIDRAIQSVLNQTYPNLEYLIIDGDSQDNTQEIIQSYADRLTHFISEPDSGIYVAMNKGIQLASGEFLYFLNADDYLYDDRVIQDVVTFLEQQPDCDLLYGDHEARFPWGDSGIYQPLSPDRMLEEFICLGDRHLHQPTTCFRANLFDRIGNFNEAYRIAADHDWFLRCLQDSSIKLCYLPRTIVSYAHGGASGQIRQLFTELYDIQQHSPICQEAHWVQQRLDRLQTMFVDKYELLESTNLLSHARYRDIQNLEAAIANLKARLEASPVESLRSEVESLKAELNAMKTSKFWKLRSAWFKLKGAIGLH